MNKFVKLNAFAALYGFVMFIQTEIMLNFYRFSRITNISGEQILRICSIAMLVIFIVSTILFALISKRNFSKGGVRFLLTILWFPYCLIFARIAAMIFPMTNRGDYPGPGMGFILMPILFAYPLYIAIITGLSTKEDNA